LAIKIQTKKPTLVGNGVLGFIKLRLRTKQSPRSFAVWMALHLVLFNKRPFDVPETAWASQATAFL